MCLKVFLVITKTVLLMICFPLDWSYDTIRSRLSAPDSKPNDQDIDRTLFKCKDSSIFTKDTLKIYGTCATPCRNMGAGNDDGC